MKSKLPPGLNVELFKVGELIEYEIGSAFAVGIKTLDSQSAKTMKKDIFRINSSSLIGSYLRDLYFFLYPAGHLGVTSVTFLVSLPLVHVMVLAIFP